MRPATGARNRATKTLAVVLPLALALSLVMQVADPRLGVFEYDDLREGQLEAAGAVVLILVGGVLVGRVRRDRSRRNLLLGAGLLMLAATELFASIATPLADSLARSTFATWTTAGGGVLAALVLAGAAWLPDRVLQRGRGSVALTLATAAFALCAVAVFSAALEGRLPAPFEHVPVFAADIEPGGEHWALLVAELVTAIALAACARAPGHARRRRTRPALALDRDRARPGGRRVRQLRARPVAVHGAPVPR